MIEPELEALLKKKIERANKVIRYSVFAIGVVVILTLIIIVIQNYGIQQQQIKDLETSRATAAANHKRTQAYVRCIAEALTVPVSQRSNLDLDNCKVSAEEQTPEADQGNTQPTAQPTQPAPQSNAPLPTNEPPVEDERSGLRQIDLIDGLLKTLGI